MTEEQLYAEVWCNSRTIIFPKVDGRVLFDTLQEEGDDGPIHRLHSQAMHHELTHLSVYHNTMYGHIQMWMDVTMARSTSILCVPWQNAKLERLFNLRVEPSHKRAYKKLRKTLFSGTKVPLRHFVPFLAAKLTVKKATKDYWDSLMCSQYLRGDVPVSVLPAVRDAFISRLESTRKLYKRATGRAFDPGALYAISTSDGLAEGEAHMPTPSKIDPMAAFGGSLTWSKPDLLRNLYPQFYDPERSSPVISSGNVTKHLNGHAIFESLSFLAELHLSLADDGTFSDLIERRHPDTYFAPISYVHERLGLPSLTDLKRSSPTFEEFWATFGFAIGLLYAALSVPVLPQCLTANEARGRGFWSLTPLDIHPGWRLVRMVESLAKGGFGEELESYKDIPVEEQVRRFEKLADLVTVACGNASPRSLWFAFNMGGIGPIRNVTRYPSLQSGPVSDESIHALFSPLKAMMGLERSKDLLANHFVFRDTFRTKDPSDELKNTDLLFDAILQKYVHQHPLNFELAEAVEDFLEGVRNTQAQMSKG